MYHIKEIVVEKDSGLSSIKDIREESFGNLGVVLYYVLQPFADKGATVYVPVDKAGQKLRSLYSAEELTNAMETAGKQTLEWNPNDRERQQVFNRMVREGTMENVFLLLRTLLEKRKEVTDEGKKFRSADERILKEVEFLVFPEVEYVLGLCEEELLNKLTKNE